MDGLSNLNHIGDYLFIRECVIENIDGLSNLETIGGDFACTENYAAARLQLDNLQSIGGSLLMSVQLGEEEVGYPLLDELILSELVSIGGEMRIKGADNLNHLSCPSLTTINNGITFWNCPSLTTIEGLCNVSVGTYISLSGMPNLNECHTEAYCDYYNSNTVDFNNQNIGVDETDFNAQCGSGNYLTCSTTANENLMEENSISIFPNPIVDYLSIELNSDTQYSIYKFIRTSH